MRHSICEPRSGKPDPARCREGIWEHGAWPRQHQCPKKPKVFEDVEGERMGFCGTHSAEAMKAREARREEKRKAETEEMKARWNRAALERASFEAVLGMTVDVAASAGIGDLWRRVQKAGSK